MSEDVRKAEAEGKSTASVDFRGQTFAVSREYGSMPVDFFEAVEDGKTVSMVRGALGPQQWRTVKAMNLTMDDLNELGDKLAQAMGFATAGNSPASSD